MRSLPVWSILLALLAAEQTAAATPTVAVVSVTAGQPANVLGVEPLLVEAVRGAGYSALTPEQVKARLSGPDWGPARARAAALLRQAASLVRQVAYDEALRKLDSAETAALEGLAHLLDPKLLAEIYYQRGIALLPTDEEAARRYLVQSLAIHPVSRIGPGTSPKITTALGRATMTAASAPPTAPSISDGARATTGLRVRFLLVLDGRQHSGRAAAAAGLFLYDAEQQSWSGARIPTGDSASVLRVRVQEAVRRLLPLRPAGPAPASAVSPGLRVPEEPRVEARPRRVLPWIATAASAGLLAAGTALVVVARNRADEYQRLAGQPSLVEYDGRPRELEESAHTFNTAGIVCLSVGGAAAVAALVLWLLPSRRSPGTTDEARWSPPGMLRLTFSEP